MTAFSWLTAFIAFVSALLFAFPVRRLARRFDWVDHPTGERKTHARAIPYGGGLAIVLGMGAGILTTLFTPPALLASGTRLWAIVLGVMLTLLIGSIDDARGLGPWTKLYAQIAIGLGMWFAGFRVEKVTNPLGGVIHFGGFGAPLTVLWYVAVMNAMNLIDGLDGLACGVAAIAGMTILGISARWSEPQTMMLSAIFVGACLGFLPHNFHPARQFLGDGGSLTLGFCLATLSMATGTKSTAMLAMLVPMVALLIPVADAIAVFTRRLKHGQHPFRGDQRHLHHRLLRIGLTHRRVVLIFYYWSGVNGVLAYLLASATPLEQSSSAGVFLVFVLQAAGFLLLLESLSLLESRNLK